MPTRAIKNAPLLAPKDLALQLGISVSRVKQLTNEGTLYGYKVSNGNTVYKDEDVTDLIIRYTQRRVDARAKRSAKRND